MYIIYDSNDEVISICSSERTLMLAIKDLKEGSFSVENWTECPEDIKSYLARL